MKYFTTHVRYPKKATENNIQGRVTCQLTVFRDGSIGDIIVLGKVDPSLDKEAVFFQTCPNGNQEHNRVDP